MNLQQIRTRNWKWKLCWSKSTWKLCHHEHKIPMALIFCFFIRNAWLLRNSVIFKEGTQQITVMHKNILSNAAEFTAIASTIRSRPFPSFIEVKWKPTASGWFKLNTDDPSVGNPGKGGCGLYCPKRRLHVCIFRQFNKIPNVVRYHRIHLFFHGIVTQLKFSANLYLVKIV